MSDTLKLWFPVLFRLAAWLGLTVCTEVVSFLGHYSTLDDITGYAWVLLTFSIGKEVFQTVRLYFDQSYARHKDHIEGRGDTEFITRMTSPPLTKGTP